MNDKNILLELKISSEGLVVGMLICILSIFLGFYLIFFTKQIMLWFGRYKYISYY